MKRRSVSPRRKKSHIRNSASSPIVETIPFHSECGQHFLCRFLPELEQYIEKTDVILQSFKKRFNAAAPINQLPVEILIRVFEIVRFHRIFGNKFPPLFATLDTGEICKMKDTISWVPRIMHICKHWQEVALFAPSLWNHTHINVKAEVKRSWEYRPPPSFLLRSHPVPRHVTVCVHTKGTRRSDPTELYDALRSITNYAETLKISWRGEFKAGILDVLRYPFPQLTSLMLRLDMGDLEDWSHWTPPTVPATIFGGELPWLRCLSLWFYTYWSCCKFPNLTHMSFHGQKVRPSIDRFLDLLESTPCLEFLLLHEAGPQIAERDLLPQRTVLLPALRRAQFITDSFDQFNITRILECLTFRQLTRCLLFNSNQRSLPWGIIDKIFIHIIPQEIIELGVYLYERYPGALEMGGSRISIPTAPTYSTSNVSVTVAAPRFKNIKYLHLASPLAIPAVNWGDFPKISTIMCYNSLNGISALITSLSDRTANSYLCPFLETLYLYVGEQLPDPS